MQAIDFDDFEDFEDLERLDSDERATLPAPPRESGVQLARVASPAELPFARMDVVVSDLTRDPRSEDYRGAGPAPRDSASNVARVRQRSPRARRTLLPPDLSPTEVDRYGT